jgi:hypothetical protein
MKQVLIGAILLACVLVPAHAQNSSFGKNKVAVLSMMQSLGLKGAAVNAVEI